MEDEALYPECPRGGADMVFDLMLIRCDGCGLVWFMDQPAKGRCRRCRVGWSGFYIAAIWFRVPAEY